MTQTNLDTRIPNAAQLELLGELAREFGTEPFTSGRAAALLDQHVQGVGNILGRTARSGALIPASTGWAHLVRVRTVTGRLSLWRFEIIESAPARDPDEDLI